MKAAGLGGVSRRICMTTTVRDHNARPTPDLVNRQFVASAAHCLWVSLKYLLSRLGGPSLPGRGARYFHPRIELVACNFEIESNNAILL
jgi:hypothetical protein